MPCGTNEELAQIQATAADVTAHKIGIHGFEISRREDSALEDTIAESGAYRSIWSSRRPSMSNVDPFGTRQ